MAVSSSFGAGFVVGAATSPICRKLSRYATCEDIPSELFRKQEALSGDVVKVADGDTFRILHCPPLSSLRLRLPGGRKRIPKARGGPMKLSDSTLQIRIAAVDCPETAKFGSAGQAFGEDATAFTRAELEGRRVRVTLLSRDQYQRAICMVHYRKGLRRLDLSEELLQRGLATVYRQGGAQYGRSGAAHWDRIEAKAKRKGVGIWSAGAAAVDPAAYKRDLKKKAK